VDELGRIDHDGPRRDVAHGRLRGRGRLEHHAEQQPRVQMPPEADRPLHVGHDDFLYFTVVPPGTTSPYPPILSAPSDDIAGSPVNGLLK
jgi:hypothetical protein